MNATPPKRAPLLAIAATILLACLVARMTVFRMPAHLARLLAPLPPQAHALESQPLPDDEDSTPAKWNLSKRARDPHASQDGAASSQLAASKSRLPGPPTRSIRAQDLLRIPPSPERRLPERPPKA